MKLEGARGENTCPLAKIETWEGLKTMVRSERDAFARLCPQNSERNWRGFATLSADTFQSFQTGVFSKSEASPQNCFIYTHYLSICYP